MSRRLDLMYKTQGNGDPKIFHYASQRGMKPRQPNPVQLTSKQVPSDSTSTRLSRVCKEYRHLEALNPGDKAEAAYCSRHDPVLPLLMQPQGKDQAKIGDACIC